MNEIVLDHIDNIKLNLLNPPISNLQALNFMKHGLFQLAEMVRIEEGKRVRRDGVGVKTFEIFGHVPLIIPCAFHWFSTSLVNYIRLVGLIDFMNQQGWKTEDLKNLANKEAIKKYCSDYVKKVIPSVYLWRNKVSAHFAPTDPFSGDNLGTLEVTVMNTIAYHTPYYKAELQWTTQGESSQLIPWALTEVFEQLAGRYWKDSELAFDLKDSKAPVLFDFIPRRT